MEFNGYIVKVTTLIVGGIKIMGVKVSTDWKIFRVSMRVSSHVKMNKINNLQNNDKLCSRTTVWSNTNSCEEQ